MNGAAQAMDGVSTPTHTPLPSITPLTGGVRDRDTARTMSQENVEIVRAANAALLRGDLEAVESTFSPDVEWRDLLHAPDAPEVVHGITAVKQIWADWFEVLGDIRANVEEWVDAGDWVICVTLWTVGGTGSGVAVDLHAADAYELTNGKTVRAVFGYESKAEALEAVGLSE